MLSARKSCGALCGALCDALCGRGQVWAQNVEKERALQLVTTDPHGPNQATPTVPPIPLFFPKPPFLKPRSSKSIFFFNPLFANQGQLGTDLGVRVRYPPTRVLGESWY